MNQVEVDVIFKHIQTFNDAVMVHKAKQDNLHWKLSKGRIVDPAVFRDLVLDDELDCDLEPIVAIKGGHDETVSTGSQLIAQLIRLGELGVELVSLGKVC